MLRIALPRACAVRQLAKQHSSAQYSDLIYVSKDLRRVRGVEFCAIDCTSSLPRRRGSLFGYADVPTAFLVID